MSTSSDLIRSFAVKAGAKWPELVVAQWHLESSKGTKLSGRNNFFGLKGKGNTVETIEYINGKKTYLYDSFLDFESPEVCVKYLVDRWYKNWNGYKGVNNASSKENAARMLQSEGYATDPSYAEKLIRVMSQYEQEKVVTTVNSNVYADLVDAAEHYQGLPLQKKALTDLQLTLTESQRAAFTKTWRSVANEKPALTKPKFPLAVPYYYQRDSKTGQGERMCQSSAIAMRIEQIDPKIIGDDDSYLSIVNRYGDTVSQAAHQKALTYLGLKYHFLQNGTEKMLCELLDQGIAVPIGILHKGNINNPTGGGHWVTLIGYDEKFFHCHDPFGELDLINGGYPLTGPTDGKDQRYTRKNLMKRWLISSKSDGWLWVIKK